MIQYLLLREIVGPISLPVPVQGASGKIYGYAEHSASLGCMLATVTAEVWEGGADKDVTRKTGQRTPWRVRAEEVLDPNAPETQAAEDMDAAKARIAALESQLNTAIERIHELESQLVGNTAEPTSDLSPIGDKDDEQPAADRDVIPSDYRQLRQQCKDAGIDVKEIKSKEALTVALQEHLAKQSE